MKICACVLQLRHNPLFNPLAMQGPPIHPPEPAVVDRAACWTKPRSPVHAPEDQQPRRPLQVTGPVTKKYVIQMPPDTPAYKRCMHASLHLPC